VAPREIVDLDAALGDTRPLWRAWLVDLGRRSRVQVDDLPEDRRAAAAILDERVGNWRALLERYAEEHAPLHFRPDPNVNASLRALRSQGTEIIAATDAPRELADVALAHLGLARIVQLDA
jgi:phosphoglycolate phosphatase-like HAD superfamily hydrolase